MRMMMMMMIGFLELVRDFSCCFLPTKHIDLL